MPYGGTAVGFGAFVLVKLAGYAGAGQVLPTRPLQMHGRSARFGPVSESRLARRSMARGAFSTAVTPVPDGLSA